MGERLILIGGHNPIHEFPDALTETGNINLRHMPSELIAYPHSSEKAEKLGAWLFENVSKSDMVVISVDALCFGISPNLSKLIGLNDALGRLGLFFKLRRKFPDKKIFALQILLNLNPAEMLIGANKEDREMAATAEWAKWKYVTDRHTKEQKERNPIPEVMLQAARSNFSAVHLWHYQEMRRRNFEIMKKVLEFLAAGIIDRLFIIARDIESPGVHLHELESVNKLIKDLKLERKTAILRSMEEITSMIKAFMQP